MSENYPGQNYPEGNKPYSYPGSSQQPDPLGQHTTGHQSEGLQEGGYSASHSQQSTYSNDPQQPHESYQGGSTYSAQPSSSYQNPGGSFSAGSPQHAASTPHPSGTSEQGGQYSTSPGESSAYAYGPYTPQQGPSSQQTNSQGKNFFAKLFDFSFRSYVTPGIISVAYIVLICWIIFVWLFSSIFALAVNPLLGLFALLIAGPINAFISLVFGRMMLEFFSAVIHLAENVETIRKKNENAS